MNNNNERKKKRKQLISLFTCVLKKNIQHTKTFASLMRSNSKTHNNLMNIVTIERTNQNHNLLTLSKL